MSHPRSFQPPLSPTLLRRSLALAVAISLTTYSSVAIAQESVTVRFAPPVGKTYRETHRSQVSQHLHATDPTSSTRVQYRDFTVQKKDAGFVFLMVMHTDDNLALSPVKDGASFQFAPSGELTSIDGFAEFEARRAAAGKISANDLKATQQLCSTNTFFEGERDIWATRNAGIHGKTVKVGSTWEYENPVISKLVKKRAVMRYVVESIRKTGKTTLVKYKGEFSDVDTQELRSPELPAHKNGPMRTTTMGWDTQVEIDASTGLIVNERKTRFFDDVTTLPNGDTRKSESSYSRAVTLSELDESPQTGAPR